MIRRRKSNQWTPIYDQLEGEYQRPFDDNDQLKRVKDLSLCGPLLTKNTVQYMTSAAVI